MNEGSAPSASAAEVMASFTVNEPSMIALAASLARVCRHGDCLLLRGDLGAGKTAFCRGVIQALSPEATEIVSPTFTLVQTYPVNEGLMIWHYDLYRLKNAHEIEEIGLDEALQSGITLIEWPEVAQDRLPDHALEITIRMDQRPDERYITFFGIPSIWQERLDKMQG